MTAQQHARRLVWPAVLAILTLGVVLLLLYVDMSNLIEDDENLLLGVTALT